MGARPRRTPMIAEAAQLVSELQPVARHIAEGVYQFLVGDRGCMPYVKTIYIGFERNRALVAALYPHIDRVELALALAEDHDDPLLVDATHLTWRTMPVAAVARKSDDLPRLLALAGEAFERVDKGTHD